MIYALDRCGLAVYVSTEFEVLTGRPVAEILGRGWVDCLHPDDREEVYLIVCEASARESAFTARCRVLFANQRYVWMVSGATPCFSPLQHGFIGLMGSFAELDDQSATSASASLGGLELPTPHLEAAASTDLSIAMDHLRLAKALIERSDNDAARQAVDLGIYLLNPNAEAVRH